VTDLDSWPWEKLSLPAGIRTVPSERPISARLSAVARFGRGDHRADRGRTFRGMADQSSDHPSRQHLPVRLGTDNVFSAADDETLPAGQYLTSTILTDQQQRRHARYRELLVLLCPSSGKSKLLAHVGRSPQVRLVFSGRASRRISIARRAADVLSDRSPGLRFQSRDRSSLFPDDSGSAAFGCFGRNHRE